MELNISGENHLKNKLEDAGNFHGEIFKDKNAAWEKLHIRLRQKEHRIKPVWYWAAAVACILLVIIIPIMIAYKEEDDLVKNNAVQQIQIKKSITQPAIIFEKNIKTSISLGSNKKAKLLKQATQAVHNKSLVTNIIKSIELPSVTLNDKEDIHKPIMVSVVIDSSLLNTIAAAPAKKKLKVVHINELGNPIVEIPNIARYYERRSFQLNLINQQAYTSSSLPAANAGFNIFKTKNIPSN